MKQGKGNAKGNGKGKSKGKGKGKSKGMNQGKGAGWTLQRWRQLLTAVGHARDLNRLMLTRKNMKIFSTMTLKFIA